MIGPAAFIEGPQKFGGKLFRPGLGLLDTQNIRRIFFKPVQKAVLFNGPYAVYIPGYNTHYHYSICLNAEKMKGSPQASFTQNDYGKFGVALSALKSGLSCSLSLFPLC
jgi:hypothetical protein